METDELPTVHGHFTVHVYRNKLESRQHIALVKGAAGGETPTLVTVQQGNLIDDISTAANAGGGARLQDVLAKLAEAESGVLVYLVPAGMEPFLKRNATGAPKQRGRARGDIFLDKPMPGSTTDLRDYGLGAQILHDLGVRKLRLLTNQPRRVVALEGFGMELIDQMSIT